MRITTPGRCIVYHQPIVFSLCFCGEWELIPMTISNTHTEADFDLVAGDLQTHMGVDKSCQDYGLTIYCGLWSNKSPGIVYNPIKCQLHPKLTI
jgi:hypothetical protein